MLISGIGLFVAGVTIFVFYIVAPWFIVHPLDFPMGPVPLLIRPENIFINSISLVIVGSAAGLIPSKMAVRETIIDSMWGD